MLTILSLALALATVCFAITLTIGAGYSHDWKDTTAVGAAFGACHIFTVCMGWLVGDLLARWREFAPWIAAAALAFLGSKLLYEAYFNVTVSEAAEDQKTVRESTVGLLTIALLASVDGTAAGISMRLMSQPLWVDVLLVGAATGLLSMCGYAAGTLVGARWGKYAEYTGGIVLLILSVRMVV